VERPLRRALSPLVDDGAEPQRPGDREPGLDAGVPEHAREARERRGGRREAVADDAHHRDPLGELQRRQRGRELPPGALPVGDVEQRDDERAAAPADREVLERHADLARRAEDLVEPDRLPDARERDVPLGHHGARPRRLPRRELPDDGLAGPLAIDRVERRPRVDGDPRAARPLDRLRADHLRAALGHLLQHRVIQLRQVPRVRDRARVRRVDPVDVAVDLAAIRLERGRERDGGRVRSAAPERGDLAAVAHPLVSRDDDDPPAGELVVDAVGPDLDDPRVEVAVVRQDARLGAGERDRLEPAGLDRDREQRHRHALAGGEQHVELAAGRLRDPARSGRRLPREGEEPVRRLAHRADDDDDVVARAPGGGDAIGDAADLLDVGHGGAAVLLHDDGAPRGRGGPARGGARTRDRTRRSIGHAHLPRQHASAVPITRPPGGPSARRAPLAVGPGDQGIASIIS
jgi:hypothetical protein